MRISKTCVVLILLIFFFPVLMVSADLTDLLLRAHNMDETSGTRLVDYTGTQNGSRDTAKLNVTGMVDRAYYYGGANVSWINKTNLWLNDTHDRTYHFCMNLSSRAGADRLISDYTINGGKCEIMIYGANTSKVTITCDVGAWQYAYASAPNNGKWYCIMFVIRPGGVWTSYVNGTFDSNVTHAGSFDPTNSKISLGRYADAAANYMTGKLDEVYLWRRALTHTEASQLHASLVAGSGYPFSGGASNPVLTELNITPGNPYTNDTLKAYGRCAVYNGTPEICYQWINTSTRYGAYACAAVTNNTLTNFANLSSAVTKRDEAWKFEALCTNGSMNSSKANATARTILNSIPQFTNIYPADEAINIPVNTTLNLTPYDIDADAFDVEFYQNVTETTESISNVSGEPIYNFNGTSCEGAPKIYVDYNTNLSWVIGHYETTRLVGGLYNLTDMSLIYNGTITGNIGAIHYGGMTNLGNTTNPNWFLFFYDSGAMASMNYTGAFEDLNMSLGDETTWDTMVSGYPSLVENPTNDEVWVFYGHNTSAINRVRCNRTAIACGAPEQIRGDLTAGSTTYVEASHINNNWIVCYAHQDTGAYNHVLCVNSSDGAIGNWDKINLLNISEADWDYDNRNGRSSFIEKNGVIIALSSGFYDAVNRSSIFFTGSTLESMTYLTNFTYWNGTEYGDLWNDSGNYFYYASDAYEDVVLPGQSLDGILVKMEYTPAVTGLIDTALGVSNGSNAYVNWTGLTANTTYYWYAVIDDGANTTTTPVYSFNTTLGGAGDSCTYSGGGNWAINCGDKCNLTSTNLLRYNFTIIGSSDRECCAYGLSNLTNYSFGVIMNCTVFS